MAKSFISKRAQFPSAAQQQLFLKRCMDFMKRDANTFAHFIHVHPKTFRGWATGDFRMPYATAVLLSKKTGILLPRGTRAIELRDHLHNMAHKGGTARYKKHGNITHTQKRTLAWRTWWEAEGKNLSRPHMTALPIDTPKYSPQLAEFVGIMIGDGGVAPYHISVTLHVMDDWMYGQFVSKLIIDLFGVKPKIYKNNIAKAFNIIVHRRRLSVLCQKLGLPLGNKVAQGVDIPAWIKDDPQYVTACLRGLFDTDGSFFKHSYLSKGHQYNYLKINFSSASPPLIRSVYTLLREAGIHARVSKNGREVRIENAVQVKKFIEIIGTHNSKHSQKIKTYAALCQMDLR
jgi:hypothetical protein